MKFKRSIVTLLMLGLLLMLAVPAIATPKVMLDGNQLSFDVAPTIENGRTLVPLRAIFEALGADVNWDGTTQTATAIKDSTQIKLQIGSQTAYKNTTSVNLDVPAKIVDGRTMVPLRFIGEAFGANVAWDASTQIIAITSTAVNTTTKQAKISFIDVGQADAIYISLPEYNDILIDGGNNADGPQVVNYLKSQGVDDIELLIATHNHEDHIGGLDNVLSAFNVENIIDDGLKADTVTYKDYWNAVQAENTDYQIANKQHFSYGNASFDILTGPENFNDVDNPNNDSVVTELNYGNVKFLFMGDAEAEEENTLANLTDINILKVGHHGSNSSTSTNFLNTVKPEVAVISVGVGNTYGHPAQETIQKLQNIGAQVYRTDLNGTVIIDTDGNKYTVTTVQAVTTPQAKTLPPAAQTQTEPVQTSTQNTTGQFVGSTESNKYHSPDCRYAEKIAPENQIWFKDAADAQAHGYEPCGVCKP